MLDDPVQRPGARERQDLVGAVGGEETVPQQLEPGGAGAVLEAGHEDHLHRHAAAGAADLAMDLGWGPEGRPSSSTGMKSVRATTPSGGPKGGLQDVGAWQIALRRGPLALGPDRPGAAALRIEDGGEDAAAVEARQAAPVDRPVEPDERGGAHVADEAVLGERERCGPGRPALGRRRRRDRLEVRHRPSITSAAEDLACAPVTHSPSYTSSSTDAPHPRSSAIASVALMLALGPSRPAGARRRTAWRWSAPP